MRSPFTSLEFKLAMLLVGLGLAVRAVLIASFEPILFPDTSSYFGLAYAIRNLDFSIHTGVRTPVYPILVILGFGNTYAIWVLQSLLGVLASWMIYRLGLVHTRNAAFSFVLALSVSLSLNLLFYEAAAMTESLSAFLIVLSAWLFLRILRSGSSPLVLHLIFGTVLGIGVLTRPALVMLAPVYLVFVWLRTDRTKRLRTAATLALPIVILVGSWSGFNKIQCDYFGPSLLTGFNLTQHCGLYMEHASDEFAPLREIYLKHRARAETHHMVIWDAEAEMLARTGSRAELARQLKRMCMDLFLRFPGAYAQSVGQALVKFWIPQNYWLYADTISPGPDTWTFSFVSNSGFRRFLETLPLFYDGVLRILFLLIAALSLAPRFRVRTIAYPSAIHAMIIVLIASSIFQAMMSNGENWRYYVPFQPILHVVVFVWVWDRVGWKGAGGGGRGVS